MTALTPGPVRPCRARGFTLIEVMITVAIVAILSSIALPAYFDYVRRGQLPEAFSNLSDYRVKLEQYYQDNRNYGAAACADVAGAPTWANFQPAGAKYFGFGCARSQSAGVTAAGGTGTSAGAASSAVRQVKRTVKMCDFMVAMSSFCSSSARRPFKG